MKSRRVPRNKGEEIIAKRNLPLYGVVAALACVATADAAFAHGIAGKRFFPATLATDDPFVADELSLPTISMIKTPASGDAPATRETDFSVDVSKRITENLGIGFGATYKQLRPDAATLSAASTISPRASSTSSTRIMSTRRSCRQVSTGTSVAAARSASARSRSAP
jgi:hypothetical protein